MTLDAIVFDFGGVLIDWDPRYLYKKIFEDKSEMEYFLHNICTQEWNQQQDAGRSLSEATSSLQKQFPKYSELIQCYYDRWEEMIGGAFSKNVDLLYRLNSKFKLYGLTNWSDETFPIARKRFDFFDLFEGIVVSGKEKMIKPDKEIFHLLLDRYGLEANSSLLIDDNLNNIVAAREIGFHAIHFGNGVDLENKLAEKGILNGI